MRHNGLKQSSMEGVCVYVCVASLPVLVEVLGQVGVRISYYNRDNIHVSLSKVHDFTPRHSGLTTQL